MATVNVVRVLPLKPVTHATRAFQAHGRVGVTVVVKLAYTLVPDGVMQRLPGATLEVEDLAPYKQLADVAFVGSAHAPGGPVAAMPVRLTLVAGEQPLLDKRLLVSGDRVVSPANPGPAATPFQTLELTWERAFGGEGFDQNPSGTGVAASAAGELRLPNVSYFDEALRHRPACYAPIPADAPMRQRFLSPGKEDVPSAEVPDLTEGVHYGYFQSGPPDQQIPFLRGDETVVLEGLSPAGAVVRSRLPGDVARARAYFPPTRETPIELSLDTLVIDGDRGLCTVTWRGCVSAGDLGMLSELIVAVAVEERGQPIAWPKPAQVAPMMKMLERIAQDAPIAAGTVELSRTQHQRAGDVASVPFARSPSERPERAPTGPIPGAPWAPAAAKKAAPAEHALRGTIALDDLAPATRRALAAGVADFHVGMPMSDRPVVTPATPAPTPKKPEAPLDPWAKSIEAAPIQNVRPPQPKPPEKPPAYAMLYGKFGAKK